MACPTRELFFPRKAIHWANVATKDKQIFLHVYLQNENIMYCKYD